LTGSAAFCSALLHPRHIARKSQATPKATKKSALRLVGSRIYSTKIERLAYQLSQTGMTDTLPMEPYSVFITKIAK
ncbi:MAG TPA: hypothetical protein VNB49_08705, partial [Candidatus Dormibacteraeota bacterium]|nr:hypothetical protein [Candidatus Dormibacteraeota bacterium]